MSTQERFRKLLVVALNAEWTHLKNHRVFENDARLKNFFRFRDKSDCGLLQIGYGLQNARFNFSKFLENYVCESVLHFGLCGALIPKLKVGALVVASTITDGNEQIAIQAGNAHEILFSSTTVLKNRDEKLNFHDKLKATAVDMESFAVAKICREKNISYQSVRSVFDTLDDNLEAIGEPYDNNGNLNTGKLVVNLIKNPKLVLEIPELKRRADLGNKNLVPAIDLFLKS